MQPDPGNPPSSSHADGSGREVRRLRLLFLLPLAAAILAIVAALTYWFYQYESQNVRQGMLRIRASAADFYQDSLHHDTRALQAVMDALQHDGTLGQALARRDRTPLAEHSIPLFEALRRDFSITHLYFSGPDRINLLRAHAPQRHGDRIERITTLSAEKNGAPAFGVELGPLGTFTLRLVTPWYEGASRQPSGYVELGMEIDRVLQQLRDFFGVSVFVLVHKDVLNRQQWEDGMRALGRTPDWERFPDVVLGEQTPQSVPPLLAERLAQGPLEQTDRIVQTRRDGAVHQLAYLPLHDAGGRHVAHLALIADVTQEANDANAKIRSGGLTALIVGLVLLVFFHWQVGRIGQRIEHDAQALEQLATRDGLTGLYNHRTCYKLLADELARSRRHGRTFALLMIDIDHFKHVNDTHGHQAGDAVLRGLSERLCQQVRTIDRVCRYGGEEIAVLLTEMDLKAATLTAERLRAAVAATPFHSGQQPDVGISITISIGVAIFPPDADNVEALVSVADHGLYAAKQGGRNRVCHQPPSKPLT